MALRDPLLPPEPEPVVVEADPPAKKAWAKSKLRTQDELRQATSERSARYPVTRWPVRTREQRIALLDQITMDLKAREIDHMTAYNERLRFAYRCMEEGV